MTPTVTALLAKTKPQRESETWNSTAICRQSIKLTIFTRLISVLLTKPTAPGEAGGFPRRSLHKPVQRMLRVQTLDKADHLSVHKMLINAVIGCRAMRTLRIAESTHLRLRIMHAATAYSFFSSFALCSVLFLCSQSKTNCGARETWKYWPEEKNKQSCRWWIKNIKKIFERFIVTKPFNVQLQLKKCAGDRKCNEIEKIMQ